MLHVFVPFILCIYETHFPGCLGASAKERITELLTLSVIIRLIADDLAQMVQQTALVATDRQRGIGQLHLEFPVSLQLLSAIGCAEPLDQLIDGGRAEIAQSELLLERVHSEPLRPLVGFQIRSRQVVGIRFKVCHFLQG